MFYFSKSNRLLVRFTRWVYRSTGSSVSYVLVVSQACCPFLQTGCSASTKKVRKSEFSRASWSKFVLKKNISLFLPGERVYLNFTISKVEDEKLNWPSRNELSFIVLILKEFYKSNISYKRVCSILCSLDYNIFYGFLKNFPKSYKERNIQM